MGARGILMRSSYLVSGFSIHPHRSAPGTRGPITSYIHHTSASILTLTGTNRHEHPISQHTISDFWTPKLKRVGNTILRTETSPESFEPSKHIFTIPNFLRHAAAAHVWSPEVWLARLVQYMVVRDVYPHFLFPFFGDFPLPGSCCGNQTNPLNTHTQAHISLLLAIIRKCGDEDDFDSDSERHSFEECFRSSSFPTPSHHREIRNPDTGIG